MFAANAQRTNASPSFGQGVTGYTRYFGAAYGDAVIGNYMTEADLPDFAPSGPPLFPARDRERMVPAGVRHGSNLLDPHGFQSHAVQLFGNSGKFRGCRDFRGLLSRQQERSDAAERLGVQVGVDMVSNVLKEFWPDVNRVFSRKHRN